MQRFLCLENNIFLYYKKLEEEIKSEISGHFLDGVLALLEPHDEYEAKCVRNAIKVFFYQNNFIK